MKLKTAVRPLRMLSTRPDRAMTTQQIVERWARDEHPAVAAVTPDPPALRTVQRYMLELSADNADGPALVVKTEVESGRKGAGQVTYAYHLKATQVAHWFLTEEAALDLLVTRQIYSRAFSDRDSASVHELAALAEQVVQASPEARLLRSRIAVVPDGIGRLPARIEDDVLGSAFRAIRSQRQLRFDYRNSAGKTSSNLVTPLALVAKDGAIYLVATEGLGDSPRHYPLHRVVAADVHFQPAQARPDFELARYVRDTHQFSHLLRDSPLQLRISLRVNQETLFHFRERPLAADQCIAACADKPGWYLVAASIPKTLLLRPFLVSMGPGLEVLEPAELRSEVADWVRGMHGHYTAREREESHGDRIRRREE